MIAGRFVIDSGNVDFDNEELISHNISNDKDKEFIITPYNSNVLYTGSSNKEIMVIIKEAYSTTKAKINQLINEDDEIRFYYEYRYDPSNYIDMILVTKKNLKAQTNYIFGELAANIDHKLYFLQSS